MKILNLLASGSAGGIETLCNNIDKYSKQDNYWVFLFKKGDIAQEMENRKKDCVFYFGYSKINLFKYIKNINKLIKKYRIEVVNIHHGGTYCNILFYYLKKLNPKVKFVRFLHSCYDTEFVLKNKYFTDKLCKHYYKKALRISDLVVCVSEAVKRSIEENFPTIKTKMLVVYNGIDNKFFKQDNIERSYFKGQTLKIIYVGRLVNVKGVDILINAITEVISQGYNVNLTIVGDGQERANLEKLVKDLELEKNISFVGKQSNVIDWLDKSDVFVYPSIWKEAFGISVVEAMSRGCIPIVSNRGGLIEVVNDGEDGFIFENKNSKDLSQKIIDIINMKEKRNIILSNAIKNSQRFTINNTIDKLNEIYIKLNEQV